MSLPYFKILDLPEPPQWLLDTIDQSKRPNFAAFNPDAEHGHMGINAARDWKGQQYQMYCMKNNLPNTVLIV